MDRYPWPPWPDEDDPPVGVSIRPLRADQVAGIFARPLGLTIPAAAVVPGGLAFLLRFRVSAVTTAWRRGAKGEQRTARRLRRLGRGWTVFHDLAIPGSRANVDHLVIGPPGVFLVDSKHYRGRLTLTPEGSLWYGHHPLIGVLATVHWEAAAIGETLGTAVTPMLCVHGAQLPWGELMVQGIPVLAADRLATTLRALPPMLGEVQVALLTERAQRELYPA